MKKGDLVYAATVDGIKVTTEVAMVQRASAKQIVLSRPGEPSGYPGHAFGWRSRFDPNSVKDLDLLAPSEAAAVARLALRIARQVEALDRAAEKARESLSAVAALRDRMTP